ncbi:MAG: hypothetical protein BWY85_02166 [Firmicutes bacterium ADurb.Bin506]|nr:MAG: hypothetical protein BWY85_02166 [Firmicutes bacterium ADurb.Bin506]
MKPTIVAFVAALLVLCILPAGASGEAGQLLSRAGQDTTSQIVGTNWLLSLMPDARNLKAPSWVREGLRAYYGVGANTVSNPFTVSQNTLPPLPSAAQLSPSSPAVVRADVVTLSSRYAATSSTMFVGDPPVPWKDASAEGYPGICDFWVNVDALHALEANPPAGVTISTTAYTSGSGRHSAIRVDYAPAASNSWFTWLFDSTSGLVLYQAEWRPLKDAAYAYVAVAEYGSMRYLELPWTAGVAPDWVVPKAAFSYQGSIRTWSPAGGPGLPIPAVLNVEILSASRSWSRARIKRVFSGEPEDSSMEVHSGTGSLAGGFWVPRTGLLKLKTGDKLDHYDPITGSTVEVGYVGAATYGSQVVAIFEWAAKYKRVWIYRVADGMLVYWLDEKVVDPISGTVQQAEWQLIEE